MKHKYDVYFNLHKHCYSVIDRELRHVTHHAKELVLINVKPVVREAGRLKVLATKRKNVHAFLRCEDIQFPPFSLPQHMEANQVTYNPKRDTDFVWKSTHNRMGEQSLLLCKTFEKRPSVYVISEKARPPELEFSSYCLDDGIQAAEWTLDDDIRSFRPPEGYTAAASLEEHNPHTGELLERSTWWVFITPIEED